MKFVELDVQTFSDGELMVIMNDLSQWTAQTRCNMGLSEVIRFEELRSAM